MKVLAALGRLIARAFVALRLALRVAVVTPRVQRQRREVAEEHDPSERRIVATPRRELLVVALLAGCVVCALAFVVLFLTGDPVQLEGLTLGGALAFLAAALGLAANGLVPQVTSVEPRPQLEHPDAEREVVGDVAAGVEGISRRRLLAAAGLGAGATLGAAVVVPAVSLGPSVGETPSRSPWRRGRLLVDEDDQPIRVGDLAEGGFVTAFPEGADKRELGSPVVVVRVSPATLELPPERAGWAPEGFVAYSKICTHAGCAVALFRSPKFEPTARQEPALQCPCHYSTFAVRRAAEVTFGPAPRALPQLPLSIDGDRRLRAAGPLSGPVGPSWWGVRQQ